LASLIGLLIIIGIAIQINGITKRNNNLKKLGEDAPVLKINGKQFRDLNKNGRLDIYEDKDALINDRVKDFGVSNDS